MITKTLTPFSGAKPFVIMEFLADLNPRPLVCKLVDAEDRWMLPRERRPKAPGPGSGHPAQVN
jgi:hypothetical protein